MSKTLCAALAVLMTGAGATIAAPAPSRLDAGSMLIPVANGCGRGAFRTIAGECVPNQRFKVAPGVVVAPPPCPRGYRRDPDPARPICYPVF